MASTSAFEEQFAQFGEIEPLPRTKIQKIVARTVSNNWTSVPHVTHNDDVDVTGLESYRRTLPDDQRVSPLIFLIKAVVDALKASPHFNSSLTPDGETLILKKYFNIGIAIDGPRGLLVGVLRDCDGRDISALAAELRDMSALARNKGLPMDKISGGCFSISSLGGIGGTGFTPIINAPEVAILGVTPTQTKPVWNGSEFIPRQMMPLSLSYDHRVINGADAARFLRAIGKSLAKYEVAI
jgi:pyruvate dehydrogenase E2 component (dihydrolipoamide acetyltransferase)